MKKFSVFFSLVMVVMAAQAMLPQPDLIASIHFAGGQAIANSPSFSPFVVEFDSTQSRALASQTLDKLSRAPYQWMRTKVRANTGDGAAELRPLLDDLLASEWSFEAQDMKNGQPEYALAIHLSRDRMELWSRNLRQLLEAWTGITVRRIDGGWELKKDLPPNLIRLTEHGDWLLVDCGQDQLMLGDKLVDSLAHEANFMQAGTPREPQWLTLDINWPRLSRESEALKQLGLPETRLEVSAKQQNLHISGKLFFPDNALVNLPAWQAPLKTIHPPLSSFTAARGCAAWLSRQAWMQPYLLAPAPDRLFVWATPAGAFQTYMAVPMPDAANVLSRFYDRVNPRLESADNEGEFLASIKMTKNKGEITMQGVPFMSPQMKVVQEQAGQFLVAGGFIDASQPAPLPPQLLQQLTLSDMVYYHWEVTAQRFPQLLNMTQLGLLLTKHQQLGDKTAAMNWLKKITPHLGATVTEIKQVSPGQMSFNRTAPVGLTALELLVLSNWLEARNFPGFDLSLPPDQNPAGQSNVPMRVIPVPATSHH